VWNSLPATIRQITSYGQFRQRLKTLIWGLEIALHCDSWLLCTIRTLLITYLLTYLLTYTHTHTRLTTLFPGLPGWAGTRKVKPIRILLKRETASGSGISWAICKSAPRSRQTTTSAPHHSDFYRLDALLPATQPTASKHWRHLNG